MSSDLHSILEFIDNLSSEQKITDGEYLRIMNNLKKVNDALPQQVQEDEYIEERREINTRYERYTDFVNTYCDGRQCLPTNIVDLGYPNIFEKMYDILKGNTQEQLYKDNNQKNSFYSSYSNMLETILPELSDTIADSIINNTHNIIKYYKKNIVTHNTLWKIRLLQHTKIVEAQKLIKQDLKDAKKSKTHVVLIEINMPHLKESYTAKTNFIRLGNASNQFIKEINAYILSKKLNNLTSRDIIHYKDTPYSLSIVVSGIDAKTRNQKRQYEYDTPELKYKITYLTK